MHQKREHFHHKEKPKPYKVTDQGNQFSVGKQHLASYYYRLLSGINNLINLFCCFPIEETLKTQVKSITRLAADISNNAFKSRALKLIEEIDLTISSYYLFELNNSAVFPQLDLVYHHISDYITIVGGVSENVVIGSHEVPIRAPLNVSAPRLAAPQMDALRMAVPKMNAPREAMSVQEEAKNTVMPDASNEWDQEVKKEALNISQTSDTQMSNIYLKILNEALTTLSDKIKKFEDHYTCPISMSFFVDPVFLAEDSQIYEKNYIESWLNTKHTSPKTRAQIIDPHLSIPYEFKACMDEARKEILNLISDIRAKQMEFMKICKCDAKAKEEFTKFNVKFNKVNQIKFE